MPLAVHEQAPLCVIMLTTMDCRAPEVAAHRSRTSLACSLAEVVAVVCAARRCLSSRGDHMV